MPKSTMYAVLVTRPNQTKPTQKIKKNKIKRQKIKKKQESGWINFR